jgi:hypothetical protein
LRRVIGGERLTGEWLERSTDGRAVTDVYRKQGM